MSDLIKAQNTPQFNSYTLWMSLGANGMPDNLTKEGLKQPNQIKIFFKKGATEITDHVAPVKAWFGTEYFVVYTIPDFKSKILTWLSAEQKDDGPLLFNLMGQCFQDIGLTKWTSIIAKQCPNNADCTLANFDKCIKGYLKAVVSFPNVGNQLILWLHTAKKPALMLMHKFMRHQVQLLSYLKGGYLHQTMEVPTAQENSEQIFFAQPKAHQFKFADLNKMVPTDPLKLIVFFEQCQATDKAAGVLEKIAKDKKQPNKKKTAHLPAAHSRELSYQQHYCHKYCNYNQSNWRNCNNHQPDYCHWVDWRHDCPQRNAKDLKSSKSYKKKDDCKGNHFKKRETRPCIMTSPLCWAWTICPEEGVVLAQDLLCALVLNLALTWAAGATTITMWLRMTAIWVHSQSTGTPTPPRVMTADVSIALTRVIPFLPPSLLQRGRKVRAPKNRESHQQRIHVSHCMSLLQMGNKTFWLIIVLN